MRKRKEIRHAPSLPNSSVHSAFLFRSSWLIVGLELRTDFTKSLSMSGGSRSWSASTLTQDISIAPWSPGEHGVSFSAPSNKTCISSLVICKLLLGIDGTYPLVVCCGLDLADWLHESILDSDTDITTRIAFAHISQCPVVCLCHFAWCLAD